MSKAAEAALGVLLGIAPTETSNGGDPRYRRRQLRGVGVAVCRDIDAADARWRIAAQGHEGRTPASHIPDHLVHLGAGESSTQVGGWLEARLVMIRLTVRCVRSRVATAGP